MKDEAPTEHTRLRLDRETILNGQSEARLDGFVRDGIITKLPIAERHAAKKAVLDGLAPGQDMWVFGYGSLMWNPAFHFVEKRPCRIYGYHRQFSFWSRVGRGSPDSPGMMLSLERGGSCGGIAYRIARSEIDTELESVFRREMLTGIYRARWVIARSENGPVRAVTFVSNPAHTHYAGRVDPETAARHIGCAEGHLGTCLEYLENCILHLAELGIRDRTLDRIHRHILQNP